ncbi:MAG: alpha/beta fold hydrolase [Rhodospirillaceae bacterium]
MAESASVGRIIALEMRPSNVPTVGQGVQDLVRPRINCQVADQGCGKDVAFLAMHPGVSFLHHYLLGPLQKRGRTMIALNSRHVNNDSTLLMERVIQDVGAGVKYLRDQGYKKVILIGNSGGGPVMSLYQSQAEKLTIKSTPDGAPFDIIPDDLPKADAIALLSAHPGRHTQFRATLDPSVLDEHDPMSVDPALDMFNRDNGPPYDKAWLERYYVAQDARWHRITDWAVGRLRELEHTKSRATDQGFVIYRSYAKPATLDPSIDPNDRPKGNDTIFGKALAVNYSAAVFGRFTTLRSFLSQWSPLSIADGPARLAETSVPVVNVHYSADEGCFPTETGQYTKALGGRCEEYVLKGARHFPFMQENGDKMIGELADFLCGWADRL